jgi:hypothetical protein
MYVCMYVKYTHSLALSALPLAFLVLVTLS